MLKLTLLSAASLIVALVSIDYFNINVNAVMALLAAFNMSMGYMTKMDEEN